MERPAIPPDDILQGMNEWLNVRSTFKAVLDESEGMILCDSVCIQMSSPQRIPLVPFQQRGVVLARSFSDIFGVLAVC